MGRLRMKKRLQEWKFPNFDENGMTKWNWICQHYEKLKLGNFVDIGAFSYINSAYGVDIGENVQIGSHCSIYSLSTIDNKEGKVEIRHGSRIGSHSTIMPSITIGEFSIIGAHSFVNIDIPPKVLAYGVPVKIIRKLTEQELESI